MGARCYCAPVAGLSSGRRALGRRRLAVKAVELCCRTRRHNACTCATWFAVSRPSFDLRLRSRERFASSIASDRPFLDLRRRFAWVICVRYVAFIMSRPSHDQRSTFAAPFARVSSTAPRAIQSGPSDAASTVHICWIHSVVPFNLGRAMQDQRLRFFHIDLILRISRDI